MPDGLLRAALTTYFQDAAFPGVQTVYQDVPWFIDGAEWGIANDGQSASILIMHIDSSSESRIAVPAYYGQKAISYTCSCMIQYQYLIPTELLPGQLEDAWVTPLDVTLDAITAKMRSDYTAGTTVSGPVLPGGAVFQMGQSNNDIRVFRDPPQQDEVARIWSWNRIEFDVTQIITA